MPNAQVFRLCANLHCTASSTALCYWALEDPARADFLCQFQAQFVHPVCIAQFLNYGK